MLGEEKMRALLASEASVTPAEKALLEFVDKVTLAAASVRQEDHDALKAHGWSDEAIYDAVSVCGLFSFYNRWNDACGTPDLPAPAYKASGKRLAEGGYKP